MVLPVETMVLLLSQYSNLYVRKEMMRENKLACKANKTQTSLWDEEQME